MDEVGGVLPGGLRRDPAWKRWLGDTLEAWRSRGEAHVRRADPGREPRLARSGVRAAIEARAAFRAGVRLDDFLRHRLAAYAARLPVPLEDLPVRIDVANGEPVVFARSARATLGATVPGGAPRTAGDRRLDALEEREGPAAAREARALAAGIAAVDARAAAAQARVDGISAAISDDLASGTLPSAPAVEATPEQLGRPPVPPAAPIHLLRACSLALLAAEAWRVADPVLAASGLSREELARAAEQAPVAAALGLAFAAGAAAAVFAFLGAAVSRLHALADGPVAPQRSSLRVVVAGAALGLAGGVAVAGILPGQMGEPVLLLAVPLAAVLLLRQGRRLEATRRIAYAAALAWDRARTVEAVARARRGEALARAGADLDRIVAEGAALRRRLHAIERRAVAAARAAEEDAALRSRRLDRLAEALAGALELDRYLFVKLAAAGAHGLRPRPARPERPARLEPAVAPERLGVA